MNADKSDAFSGFLCAGGEGKEESCYVRNRKKLLIIKEHLLRAIFITTDERNIFNNEYMYLFDCRLH